jgi:hypothetical protein
VVVGDGAGENAAFFDRTTTETISKYISDELIALCPNVSLDDLTTVMLHPVTDEPIFIIEDMPHVVKRLVNALERSSNPKAKRDLRWNGEPMNLSMIRSVWEATGGKSGRLQDTKLTMRHFKKDANSRMIVSYAVQVRRLELVHSL